MSQQLAQETFLLERTEQLIDAWVAFWMIAQKVEADDEVSQQDFQLEDAGLAVVCGMDTWEEEIRNEITTTFSDYSGRSHPRNLQDWTEPARAHFPLLDLIVIRRMAADFSPRTAASKDRFMLRHFKLLVGEALHTVGLQFACMEALGTLPQQIRYVHVVLVFKASSGLRPIGVSCAIASGHTTVAPATVFGSQ